MQEDIYTRQRDVLTPDDTKQWKITVVGVGGIGSWATFLLGKIGVSNITIFDFDKVEAHNLPSQFYKEEDIGEYKVNALEKRVGEFNKDALVLPMNFKYDGTPCDILICAVDSIEERKKIANLIDCDYSRPRYIIDARMGLEQMEVYIPKSPSEWWETFPEEGKVDHDPCTAKAIGYNTAVIGGIISSIVKKIIKGEQYPEKFIFDLATYIKI